jgi:hypothetical protein
MQVASEAVELADWLLIHVGCYGPELNVAPMSMPAACRCTIGSPPDPLFLIRSVVVIFPPSKSAREEGLRNKSIS